MSTLLPLRAAKHKAAVLGLSVSTESGSRGPYAKKAEADLARVERRLEAMKDQKARIAHDSGTPQHSFRERLITAIKLCDRVSG